MAIAVAILGGSFDPPHFGHQAICLWALSTKRIDQVWWIPTFQHAFDKSLTRFEERLAMCQLAANIFDDRRVRVLDVERDLGGKSRTAVTLAHLRETYPEHDFSLLIGSDLIEEMYSWHDGARLKREEQVLVANRAGFGLAGSEDIELPMISSSDVRQAIRTSQSVPNTIPQDVARYIRERKLYGLT